MMHSNVERRRTMRGMKLANRLALAAALAAACCAAQAKDLRCDVDSEYDLTLTDKSLVLTRDDGGAPRAIVMRQGRLFVDDRWVALTAADSKRIADYEQQARGIMPLAQQIGRDAADIAFTTLGEVAAGLSSTPAETRAHLDQARAKIDARLARSVTATRFSGDDLGKGIAEAIGETLPIVIGDIVGGAISA